MVWYRKKVFSDLGLRPPKTWDAWLALNDAIIAEPGVGTPPALGGADGWMLALAGGLHTALVQQFPDAALEVFKYHRAVMVVAPDFAGSVIRHFGVPPDEVDTFTFPAQTTKPGPLVRGGDLLVLTRPASQAAVELIRYLGTPLAPVPWIRDTGGFIAANPDTDPAIYSPTLRRLANELRGNPASFDLADQLGAVGGRDGLQLVLQDFLRATGSSRDEAVRAAMGAMVAAEAG